MVLKRITSKIGKVGGLGSFRSKVQRVFKKARPFESHLKLNGEALMSPEVSYEREKNEYAQLLSLQVLNH